MDGIIVRIAEEKGFGFIKGDNEVQDYFFHYTALQNSKLHQGIVGKRVSFDPTNTTKGLRAENVYVEGMP